MDHRKAGVTLVELTIVLVLIGILVAIAAPALNGMVARTATAAALNRFAVDVAYARMMAVRGGARTEIIFTSGSGCPRVRGRRITADGYTLVLHTTPARVIRRTVPRELNGACLESNNDRSMMFGTRGLLVPFENRTVWARHGSARDSLSVSVLGRVYRRF